MKTIGGPVMREYPEAKAEGLIEPGIEVLTDAFYAAGVYPLSSCEGHQTIGEGIFDRLLSKINKKAAVRPFVMFSAPEAYARSFQRLYNCTNGFHYCWMIKGHFHPNDYELVWIIEPADVRLARGDVDAAMMESDIKLLGDIAIQASSDGGKNTATASTCATK